jgi:hypothetical protein
VAPSLGIHWKQVGKPRYSDGFDGKNTMVFRVRFSWSKLPILVDIGFLTTQDWLKGTSTGLKPAFNFGKNRWENHGFKPLDFAKLLLGPLLGPLVRT